MVNYRPITTIILESALSGLNLCEVCMKVELMSVMGDDTTIVNSAVVSKRRHINETSYSHDGFIRKLIVNGELEPFEHPQIQLHITAPLEVAHKLKTHINETVWSELGETYTSIKHLDQQVEFYIPTRERWREKSDDERVAISEDTMDQVIDLYRKAKELYTHLVELKRLTPEEAALILPRSTYTEWLWTASLLHLSKVCQTYNHKDSNVELKEITKQISDLLGNKFPISWKYLLGSY